MSKVHIDFFTHPVCSGCWDVARMLEQITGELADLVECERWSLADKKGRARAQELEVLEVPTIIIDGRDRIVGVPRDITLLRDRILSAASGPAA